MIYKNHNNQDINIQKLTDQKLVHIYRWFSVLVKLIKGRCNPAYFEEINNIKETMKKEIKDRKIVMSKI